MTAQLLKLPAKARSKSTQSYQLRVELKGVKPAVWRRIAVPGTIKLSKLHQILLAAMGWPASGGPSVLAFCSEDADPAPASC